MSGEAQLGMFGEETPVGDLALSPSLRDLAAYQRRFDDPLTPMEAGAFLHERRGKHGLENRCEWCVIDGSEALTRLREKQASR